MITYDISIPAEANLLTIIVDSVDSFKCREYWIESSLQEAYRQGIMDATREFKGEG